MVKHDAFAELTMLPLSDIKASERTRKDMGDIGVLRESIERIGLLHPIVVDEDYHIVAGSRRVEAYRQIGANEIPTIIATTFAEKVKALEAERDENTCRKPFTPCEAVAHGEKLRKAHDMEKVGLAKKQEGRKKGGVTAGRGRPNNSFGGNSPKAIPADNGKPRVREPRTDDIIAASVGMDRKTYTKAKVVVDSGVPELIDLMDSGEVSVSAAADVAALPKRDLQAVAKKGAAAVKQAAKMLRDSERQREAAAHPISKAYIAALEDVVKILNGVRQEYGGWSKMVKHKGWDKSETSYAQQLITALHQSLGELKKEFRDG